VSTDGPAAVGVGGTWGSTETSAAGHTDMLDGLRPDAKVGVSGSGLVVDSGICFDRDGSIVMVCGNIESQIICLGL
jgi:hypothetical protein